MAIRNILVSYNGADTAEGAVRLAVSLAKRHDAHLTGLFAHSTPSQYARVYPYLSADLISEMTRQEQEAEAGAEAGFHALLAAEGMTERFAFFAVQGYPNDVFSEFARTYDLSVIAQPQGQSFETYREAYPDSVAYLSGRPVLVAPRSLPAQPLHSEAVLAWDGGRAAARALADALNLLDEGSKLQVLHVGDDDQDVRLPGHDIMEHLSRHGLDAELRVEAKAGRRMGQAILDAVRSVGAGLLIMGAYEHSRFSEAILGGATKDVLQNAPIPVLIAH